MGRQSLLWAGLVCFAAACSDSSSSSGVQNLGNDANAAQSIAASSQSTASATSLALQASFNQIDSANYPPLASPPNVTANGDANSGSVLIDFAGGVTVNNATYTGTLSANYAVTAVNGNTISASVDVDFSQLTVTTNAGGTVQTTGTVNVTATLTNTTAMAALGGSLTQTDGTNSVTVTPNVVLTLDGSSGTVQADGNIGVDHNILGTWNATFTALTATVAPTNRDITGGSLQLDRNTFPQVSVTLSFTGLNSGNFSISPTGINGSFML